MFWQSYQLQLYLISLTVAEQQDQFELQEEQGLVTQQSEGLNPWTKESFYHNKHQIWQIQSKK